MMEQQKIYLLPKLTIGDLAQKIGTNKTYLSNCLNNSLHISFHDYVNKFRVDEACAIMDSMTIDSKHNMAEISVACGFNSISSFNRHFLKFKGVSPRDYLVEKCKQALWFFLAQCYSVKADSPAGDGATAGIVVQIAFSQKKTTKTKEKTKKGGIIGKNDVSLRHNCFYALQSGPINDLAASMAIRHLDYHMI